MPYTWLLFDADNTLFDFDASEASAFARTLEEVGVTSSPQHLDAFRRVSAVCWAQLEKGQLSGAALRTVRFSMWAEEARQEVPIEDMSRRYLRNLAAVTDLVDGAEAVLDAVSKTHRLALITNGLSDVQRPRLAASTIGHHFDAIAISDEEGVAKPDAGLFDIAHARMGAPDLREVLMIGDSLASDIRGAVGYGIDTCWFNRKRIPLPADLRVTHEITHLSALHGIV